MVQSKLPKQVIIAEYIVGKADAQRGDIIKNVDDILPQTELLVNSTKAFQVPVYVLTNEFLEYQTSELIIQQQLVPSAFKNLPLYYMRWMMAYQFLFAHPEIEEAVFVDLGDVEMLHNPFGNLDENRLYFSDEEALLTNVIVSQGVKPKYATDFFNNNKHLQLLDPGVIAGKRSILIEYLGLVTNTIAKTAINMQRGLEEGLQTFEMAIMNYVAYRYFPNRLRHGRQVSTVIFQNKTNEYSWFKHK